jgi:hypothetical protein
MKRSNSLKGAQRTGDGRILLKTFRNILFNDDLSNESIFGRIHLARQYLQAATSYIMIFNFSISDLFYVPYSPIFLLKSHDRIIL